MKSMFSSNKAKRPDLQRALAQPPSLSDLVETLTRAHLERGPRKNVWCVCALSTNSENSREAIIIDVSRTGARVRFRQRCRLPGKVRIKAGRLGLNRMAEVVWQDNYNAGLRFIPSGLG